MRGVHPFKCKKKFLEFLKSGKTLNEYIVLQFDEKLTGEEIEPYLGNFIDNFYFFANCDITEEFFEKHFDELVTSSDDIYLYVKLSEPFLEKCIPYWDNFVWSNVSASQKLSESFIEKYSDKVDWERIFSCQDLSIPFIEKWYRIIIDNIQNYQSGIYKLDARMLWNNILAVQNLDSAFVKKYFDKIDWNIISGSITLEIARDYKDYINWNLVSSYGRRDFSEEFADEFADKLNLSLLCESNKFSEAFLEKHIKNIKINNILATQSVSPDFILRHSGKFTKISKRLILKNNKIKKDMEFYEKVGHLFQFSSVPYSEDVLREIIKKNLYKFDVNQFIAGSDLGCLRQVGKFLVD
jgi:hypothetical protein